MLAAEGPPFEGDLSFSEAEAAALRLAVQQQPQRWNRQRVAQHFTRLELIDRAVRRRGGGGRRSRRWMGAGGCVQRLPERRGRSGC